MGDEADYIVLRRHPDLPGDFRLPQGYDGRWFDRRGILQLPPPHESVAVPALGAVAVPAGRFEVRSDGAVAEVWEVQP